MAVSFKSSNQVALKSIVPAKRCDDIECIPPVPWTQDAMGHWKGETRGVVRLPQYEGVQLGSGSTYISGRLFPVFCIAARTRRTGGDWYVDLDANMSFT